MQAGKLDRRITIQQPVETQNSFGEIVVSYTNFAEVWAEVIPLSGRELLTAGQILPEATMRINIRWLAGINEKFRILYDNVAYDIQYIAELKRREGLQITVKRPE
jgi:SPP1 family predicted phage head-tail adaptor